MARKARMTVFSRFLLLMLFIGPLSYFAASFYNGENGVENITDLFNKGKEKVANLNEDAPASIPAPVSTPSESEQKKVETYEMKKLKRQMDELYKDNQRLKMKIRNLEAQLQPAQ